MRVVLTAITLLLLLAGCSVTSERDTAYKESVDSDCTDKVAQNTPEQVVDYEDMKRI